MIGDDVLDSTMIKDKTSSNEELLMSIRNLFSSKYLSILKDKVHFNLTPDILEQIKMVLISIGKGNGDKLDEDIQSPFNTHFYAAIIVILSHKIDDIFDKYENHSQFRVEVENLLKEPTKDEYDNLLKRILNVTGQNEVLETLEYLREFLTSKQFNLMSQSIVKMIIAGLAQTTFRTEATDPKEQQNQLTDHYKRIIKLNLKSSSLVDIINDETSPDSSIYRFPNEIWISTASSLQEMFACVEDDIDLEEIELWNGLLGPLVFLNNVLTEKEHDIRFLDRNTKYYDYDRFIKTNWNELRKILVEKSDKGKLDKKRVIQFALGHLLLLKDGTSHSYKNFPEGLSELSKVYSDILQEMIAFKLLNEEELNIYKSLL